MTEALRHWDRRTVDGFRKLDGWIGYAEEHGIVLDFGDRLSRFEPDDRLVLCLAGWVEYPYSQTNYAAATAGVPSRPRSSNAGDDTLSPLAHELNVMWDNMDRMLKDQAAVRRQTTANDVKKAVRKARERLGKKPGEKLIISISTTMTDWLGIFKRGEKVAKPGQLPHAVRTLDVLLGQLPQYGFPTGMTQVLKNVTVQQRIIVPQRPTLKLRALRGLANNQEILLPLLYEIQNWKNTVRADRVAETLRGGIGGLRKLIDKIPFKPFGSGYRAEDLGLLSVVNQINATGRNGVLLRKELIPAGSGKLHVLLNKILGRDITPAELAGLQKLLTKLDEAGSAGPGKHRRSAELVTQCPQDFTDTGFCYGQQCSD